MFSHFAWTFRCTRRHRGKRARPISSSTGAIAEASLDVTLQPVSFGERKRIRGWIAALHGPCTGNGLTGESQGPRRITSRERDLPLNQLEIAPRHAPELHVWTPRQQLIDRHAARRCLRLGFRWVVAGEENLRIAQPRICAILEGLAVVARDRRQLVGL